MIPYENGIPGVGNKLAFEFFIKKMKAGYYISIDANDFKNINKISHMEGDLAIKTIGKTLRNACLLVDDSKLFRSGGDEFVIYCEEKENVFIIIEKTITELEKINSENHIYKISLSFGIGITYADAEQALSQAKLKKTRIAKNIVHSNI
jgi:diguanylate cyclase (GGDEF)-like protein